MAAFRSPPCCYFNSYKHRLKNIPGLRLGFFAHHPPLYRPEVPLYLCIVVGRGGREAPKRARLPVLFVKQHLVAGVMALNLPLDMRCHRLQYLSERRSEWMRYLSADEREQMRRFGSGKRQREFLLGRAALRTLLGDYLGESPEEVLLYQADDGAPEVAGSDLQVSLTHSHGWAAAIVSRRPVGIDMEYIKPRHDQLYRQILHDTEVEMFEALPGDHYERQILCWTLKEATLKAERPDEPLSLKNMRIECDYAGRTAEVYVVTSDVSWNVSFDRVDNFFLAVAYPDE